jgi:hypothetical protein
MNQPNVPKDICAALSKLFGRLDDEDKATIEWLMAARVEALQHQPAKEQVRGDVVDVFACAICGADTPDWKSIDTHECKACVLQREFKRYKGLDQHQPPQQAAQGDVTLTDEEVFEALEYCWNDWVADTGNFPDDFHLSKGKLSFGPGPWARSVSNYLRRRLASKLAPSSAPSHVAGKP